MPKIIQINGKVNLIKNHVKIKTVSHGPWLRSFCLAWGLGGKLVPGERNTKTCFEFFRRRDMKASVATTRSLVLQRSATKSLTA